LDNILDSGEKQEIYDAIEVPKNKSSVDDGDIRFFFADLIAEQV
jgi:hypothetical protein